MQTESPPKALLQLISKTLRLSKLAFSNFCELIWTSIYPRALKDLLCSSENLYCYAEFFDVSFYRQCKYKRKDHFSKEIQKEMKQKGYDQLSKWIEKNFKHFFLQVKKYQMEQSLVLDEESKRNFVQWYWTSLNAEEEKAFMRAYYQKKEFQQDPELEKSKFLNSLNSFCKEYFESQEEDQDRLLEIQDQKQQLNKPSCSKKQSDKNDSHSVLLESLSQQAINYVQISPPLIFQRYQPRNKRSNKQGFLNIYQCNYCLRQYAVNKQRCLDHKTDCAKRKIHLNCQKMISQENQISRQIIEGHQRKLEFAERQDENQKFCLLEKQILELKTQMNIILQHPGKTYFQQQIEAEALSKKIWNETVEAVSGVIQNQLKQQIVEERVHSKTSCQKILRTMRNSLISRFYEFDVKELMISWSYKLLDSCNQLLSHNRSNNYRPQTLSRDNTAAKFLQQFNEYELTSNHKKFLQDLISLTKYKRTNVVRFYNKLFHKFPQLNLKVLPINLNIYKFTFQRKILSLVEIRKQIVSLWAKGQKILAVDIWAATCLGLRRSQFMKIQFKDSEGLYFKYCKAYQHKNQNITSRFIPVSLLKMIDLTSVSFPLGLSRYTKARNYCLSALGQFYGLRHVCLTQTVSALLNKNEFGFHKRAHTTLSRYINLEDYQLINKAFDLPEFQSLLESISISYSPFYPFFQEKGNIILNSLESKAEIILPEENEEDFLDDKNRDSALSNNLDIEYVKSEDIEKEEKVALFEKQHIYSIHHQQLLEDGCHNYGEAINYLLDHTKLCSTDIASYEQQISQPITVQSRLHIISQILKINIVSYNFTLENNEIKTEISHFKGARDESFQPFSQLIISRSLKDIKFSDSIIALQQQHQSQNNQRMILNQGQSMDKQLKIKSQNRRKLRCRSEKQVSYHFSPGTSICQGCYKYLQLIRKQNKFHLRCSQCGKKYPSISSLNEANFSSNQILMVPINCKTSSLINQSIKAASSKNNLREIVQNQFGYNSYTTDVYYSNEIPKTFTIEMAFHSKKTQAAIAYNKQHEEHLPLMIKSSLISNAGLGLFSNTLIKKGELIITYNGIIRTHCSLQSQNDSLFILGWLASNKETQGPLEIMIEPKLKLNAGRFANSGNEQFPSNSSSILGLVTNPKNNNIQIIVYLYASKDISVGEEILYDYGDSYSLFENVQEE